MHVQNHHLHVSGSLRTEHSDRECMDTLDMQLSDCLFPIRLSHSLTQLRGIMNPID
jgi:hypothetical protein